MINVPAPHAHAHAARFSGLSERTVNGSLTWTFHRCLLGSNDMSLAVRPLNSGRARTFWIIALPPMPPRKPETICDGTTSAAAAKMHVGGRGARIHTVHA